MIEVEIKLPIKNPLEIKKKLLSMGFVLKHIIQEEDTYFDNSEQRIRLGGEALRIRTVNFISENSNDFEFSEYFNADGILPDSAGTDRCFSVVTFKGKKLDTISMTRKELEAEVKDPHIFFEILQSIGYEPVLPVVKKLRCEYTCSGINACLDVVEGLGEFLELEIIDEKEENREKSLKKISNILSEIGFSIEDTVNISYLSMLQKRSI